MATYDYLAHPGRISGKAERAEWRSSAPLRHGRARHAVDMLIGNPVVFPFYRRFCHAVPGSGKLWSVPVDMHPWDMFNLMRGHYEVPERKVLAQVVRTLRRQGDEPSAVIDLGANIGKLARDVLDGRFLRNGKLVCVEPNPRAIPHLQANMYRAQQRHPHMHIRIVESAIAAPGQNRVGFNVVPTLGSGVTSAQFDGRPAEQVTVGATGLSTLLVQERVTNPLVIMDIEGSEVTVLENDARALQRCKALVIELHGPALTGRPDRTPDVMAKMIRDLGFTQVARKGDTYGFIRNQPAEPKVR